MLAGLQGQPNSSFLTKLQEVARPEDFVVVKEDIEGQKGAPEAFIVEAIANRPEIAALVDEIFFEDHFWFDGLDFGWGNLTGSRDRVGDVDDALRLMHKLRVRGVRSHFWI